MSNLREIAYRIDPASWVREVLAAAPAPARLDGCVCPALDQPASTVQLGGFHVKDLRSPPIQST